MVRKARKAKKANRWYLRNPKWEKVREQCFRRDNYICQKCEQPCRGKRYGQPAPECDHIQPKSKRPDLEYTLGNLRTLCKPCHSRITMSDTIGRGKPQIGADGYPKNDPPL